MKGLRVSAVVSGLVGLVCIGLLIAGLVSKDTIGGKRYGIILDAGSSGTRVYVYNWPGAIPSGDEYPRVTPDPVYLKIKPGLSELGGHTTGEVVSYLEPLLTYGEQNVPADKEYLTPIFLRATAGLRLLPQDQQDALMHDVVVAFESETDFAYVPNGRSARVIEGTHEGGYMFIAVNYALQNLRRIVPLNATAGILDCGGASTQIAYVPQGLDVVPEDYTAPFLDGVYTTSYLLYGKNEARYRLYRLVMTAAHAVPGAENTYFNPCMPIGLTDFSKTVNATFVGTSDVHQCRDLVGSLLNVTKDCPTAPNCGMDGQYMPALDKHGPASGIWYATSNYVAAVQNIGLGMGVHVLRDVVSSVTSFCALNATAQQAVAGPDADIDDHWCFVAMWTSELMATGYSFDLDTAVHYEEKISSPNSGTYAVSWTLGAMIREAGIFDYPRMKTKLKARVGSDGGTAVLMVAGAVGLGALVLAAALLVLDHRTGEQDEEEGGLSAASPLLGGVHALSPALSNRTLQSDGSSDAVY